MYKVIDNFLEEKDFLDIQTKLLSPNFPWYYNDTMTGTDNCFFHHHIYSKHKIWSDIFELCSPLMQKLDISAMFELRANLVIAKEKHWESEWHYDFDHKKGKTAILYINDNNGCTIIDKNKKHKVESKANRICIFDNKEFHKMISQTNSKRRVVLNINYFQK